MYQLFPTLSVAGPEARRADPKVVDQDPEADQPLNAREVEVALVRRLEELVQNSAAPKADLAPVDRRAIPEAPPKVHRSLHRHRARIRLHRQSSQPAMEAMSR